MPIRIRRHADRRVPELRLDVAQIRAVAQQPRRERMPGRVILPMRQARLLQEHLPHGAEVRVMDEAPDRAREYELTLLRRPRSDLALELHVPEMIAERGFERR